MLNQLTFGTGCIRPMVFAIAAVAFGSVLASSAEAQHTTTQPTIWTITIDATGPQGKPAGYKVSRNNSTAVGCRYVNSDATNLMVCPRDTVQWEASTTEDSSHKMQSDLRVYPQDPVLMDQKNNYIPEFYAPDGKLTAAGTVDSNTSALGDHEYYVVAFDKLTKQWYVEDPKIRIGTGNEEEDLVHDIQKDCGRLIAFLRDKQPTKEEDAKKICEEDNRKLKDLLHLK